MMQKLGAEFFGTFMLVFCGCATAVLGAPGLLGVALAFGIAVIAMAYAVGHISGGYFNPALTVAAAVNCRLNCKEVLPYIIAQILGAIVAAYALSYIAAGKEGYNVAKDMLAATGFGEHSPGGYSQAAAMAVEIIGTALFAFVMLGSTDSKAPAGFAPIAIGLTLALLILVAGAVSNGSLNPARSMGPAVVAGGWAWKQLWLFWVGPIIGAVIGGYVYKWSMCCSSCCSDKGDTGKCCSK